MRTCILVFVHAHVLVYTLLWLVTSNVSSTRIQGSVYLGHIYNPVHAHAHRRCLTAAVVDFDAIKSKFDDYVCDKFYYFSKDLAIHRAKRKLRNFASNFTRPITSLAENISHACNQIAKNRLHAQKSPHALRHKRWNITYQTKTGFFSFGPEETFQVEFNNDGTLVTSKGQHGTWKASRGNVTITIPKSQQDNTNIYFSAHLCWNSLGASAFMQRGSIYMDRPKGGFLPPHVFRPVIGRFTAKGIPE